MSARFLPLRFAHSVANFSDARKSAAEPSVTCEQSLTLMRPPMTWLNFDSFCAWLSLMNQLRVCASGLRLAFE